MGSNNAKFVSLTESNKEIGFSQSIVTSPIITSHQSKYQKISVHASDHYGKILVLDDVVQLTDRDACSYNEMMAHIPLMEHRCPRRVLIIGGGDGYVLKEVLKHPSVEHVDHVELDEDVIKICKEHFPLTKDIWNDKRVHLHIADGKAFVENAPSSSYDVIVQDSSDPFAYDETTGKVVDLPSGVLYGKAHFEHMFRVLKTEGILNFQAETFSIPSDLEGIVGWRKQALIAGFEKVKYGTLFITSYIGGQIGFLMCKKGGQNGELVKVDLNDICIRWKKMSTEYYQPKLQESSFCLPYWVEKAINSRPNLPK